MGAAVVAALLAVLTGCGPPPAVQEFNQMVSATKDRHKASVIKAAVIPLLAANASTNVTVPAEVRSLPLFAQPGSTIDTWSVGDPRGVAFVTGSGFGHWGVVVCPFKDGERAARTLHGTITPWEDGVYFWIER
jgi:hypothetical protein